MKIDFYQLNILFLHIPHNKTAVYKKSPYKGHGYSESTAF